MTAAGESASGLPALGCPSCGGRTRPGPGGRYDCTYCGGRFLDADGGGVPTLTPARHLGVATLYHAGLDWLRREDIAPRPAPTVDALALLFVPFWRYEATLSGWLLTRPQGRPPSRPAPAAADAARGRDDGARLAARLAACARGGEEERLAAFLAARPPDGEPPAGPAAEAAARAPRTSAVLRPVAWSGPGCDVRDFGLVGIHQLVSDDRLVPFDFAAAERCGAVCQVAGSVATVRRQAERAVLNQLAASQQILRRRVSFVRERVELVYYPVAILKYRVAELACRLVLDGVRGTALAGSRPFASPDGLPRLLGGIALWSCLWSASAAAGAGCVPLLWLGDAWARGGLASPAELASRAADALAPPRRGVEPF